MSMTRLGYRELGIEIISLKEKISHHSNQLAMVGENRDDDRSMVGPGSSNNKTQTLEEYGMNLTKLAEEVIHYIII